MKKSQEKLGTSSIDFQRRIRTVRQELYDVILGRNFHIIRLKNHILGSLPGLAIKNIMMQFSTFLDASSSKGNLMVVSINMYLKKIPHKNWFFAENGGFTIKAGSHGVVDMGKRVLLLM